LANSVRFPTLKEKVYTPALENDSFGSRKTPVFVTLTFPSTTEPCRDFTLTVDCERLGKPGTLSATGTSRVTVTRGADAAERVGDLFISTKRARPVANVMTLGATTDGVCTTGALAGGLGTVEGGVGATSGTVLTPVVQFTSSKVAIPQRVVAT
jgi:hypothetical protein